MVDSCAQELCPLTSTMQESVTLCTPMSWSRTGQTPTPGSASAHPEQPWLNQQCWVNSLCLPPACTLLLPWHVTWVSLSLISGWWWLIRSRCPLTLSGTSTLSLMDMSLVSSAYILSLPLTLCPTKHAPSAAHPLGDEVKQADVVLLGYPVPFPLSPDVRRRNLEIYEAVTSPQGPAMTWVRT